MYKLIFILVIVVPLVYMYMLMVGYVFPWERYYPSWTLRGDEHIEEIIYSIHSDFSTGGNVKVIVYLQTSDNKKLSKEESLRVNGQLIEPHYYYTHGVSSGYEYSAEIPRSAEYTLQIKRQNGEEIQKKISSRSVSVVFPETLSKSEPFTLVYTAPEGQQEFTSLIELASPTNEPILTNDKYQFGLTLSTKVENSKIVWDTESPLSPGQLSKFESLKNIQLLLNIGILFKQPDGAYVMAEEKEVQIAD